MANLTPEEVEFLKSQGLPVPEEETEQETTSSSFSQDDLIPDEILYGGTEEEWKEYTDRLVAENTPANTAPVTQETRDAFTYDNLYGTFTDPETGETKDKPDLSIYDRIGSIWYDIVNPEGAEPKDSQKARDQYNTDKEKWTEATRDLYEGNSFYTEDGKRIYDRYVPVRDENGNIVTRLFSQQQTSENLLSLLGYDYGINNALTNTNEAETLQTTTQFT